MRAWCRRSIMRERAFSAPPSFFLVYFINYALVHLFS